MSVRNGQSGLAFSRDELVAKLKRLEDERRAAWDAREYQRCQECIDESAAILDTLIAIDRAPRAEGRCLARISDLAGAVFPNEEQSNETGHSS